MSGTFWGTLIGLIFLMPLAGAAIGAASGAIGGALSDVGLNVTPGNPLYGLRNALDISSGTPEPHSTAASLSPAYHCTI